ncbi:GNAT family protein [Streptomyces crystallinus]|uniref:Ribosomal protein S5-alanine N-acetyltransferase n=1 Tax=Streptomyces crystallinus TaxID=68191 RepID=A0ABN1FMN8_9ACTN
MIDGVAIREISPGDAAGLAETFRRNRERMRPFEPYRPEEFFTERGQRDRIRGLLAEREAGRMRPYVLIETATGTPVGAVNLGSIALGPFRSGGLGYWVDQAWAGRGLATAAVNEVCRVAREELGLHRVEAGTLVDNLASQRVLTKAGFQRYGTAPDYLHINGAWRDHHLFQRLLHDEPPAL